MSFRKNAAQLREQAQAAEQAEVERNRNAAKRKAAKLHGKVVSLVEDFGRDSVVAGLVNQIGTDALIDAIVKRDGGIRYVVEALVESHGGRKAVVEALFERSGIDTYVINEVVEALTGKVGIEQVVEALTRPYGGDKRIAALLPRDALLSALSEDALLSALRGRVSDALIAAKLDGRALREAYVGYFPERELGIVRLFVGEITHAERGDAEAKLAKVVNAFRKADEVAKDAKTKAESATKAAESATEVAQNAVKVSIAAKDEAERAKAEATILGIDIAAKDEAEETEAVKSPFYTVIVTEGRQLIQKAKDLNEEAEAAKTRRAAAKDAATAAAETLKGANARLEEETEALQVQIARTREVWEACGGRFIGVWPCLTEAQGLLPVEDAEETEAETTDDEGGNPASAESEGTGNRA